MNKHRLVAGASLLALGSTPACVADQELAGVSYGFSHIAFQPYNVGSGHVLRVSCDSGDFFERQYPAGETIWYQPVGEDSSVLSDGNCSYELRPFSGEEDTEEGERGKADVQFGSFQIVNGQILEPTATEADSSTSNGG